MVRTIEWKDGKVLMLDQSRLPCEVRFVECDDYLMIAEGIKKLWIRGAPAIGIAAAMGVALGARDVKASNYDEFMSGLEPVFETLLSTRPTAVNIKWVMDRIKNKLSVQRHNSVPDGAVYSASQRMQ